MTISFEVNIDEAAVADAVSAFEFVGGNTTKAIQIAINKTGPKIRTLASAAIRKQVNLKASYIRDRLFFDRAMPWNLSGKITTTHRGLLLPRYSTNADIRDTVSGGVGTVPKTPKLGIRIKIKSDGASKILRGGEETAGNKPFFMILRRSGALGIVARLAQTGPRGGKIKAFYGPSLSQVFSSVRGDILPKASEEYQSQLLDAMRYILVKKYPPEAPL